MTDNKRFTGKVAIVTGGASGIGAAAVARLIGEGAQVLVADRDAAAGSAYAHRFGDRAAFARADVSNEDDIEAMVDTCTRRFGGIDILVNNAGIGGSGETTPDLDPATWRNVMAINIDAVFHCCRHAIPVMRGRGGGAIVNMASISGLAGDHAFTAYNASKAAVINYTRSLALDHASDGIRVNAICPGLIETALTAPLKQMPSVLEAWTNLIPLQRAGRADEIAAVVAFLASEDASYITGSVIVADGGITAGTGQPNLTKLVAAAMADAV